MAPITLEMIRKRAEHNEGIVATLKELSLHQHDIERIEVLGQVCRHLEILYLQNNLISRIENVHRLKELQYLNLAVNNIKRIEGLERCESLTKLDLTVNFVDKEGLLTIERLRANELLRELYLTGNPCQDFPGYRNFVVATLPSLQRLDGTDIVPSERIAALQVLPAIRAELVADITKAGGDIETLTSYSSRRKSSTEEESGSEEEEEPRFNDKGERVRKYSAKTRLQEHREMEALRKENEEKKEANSRSLVEAPPKPPRREGFEPLPADGKIYQKNEGRWDFTLVESEDGSALVLDLPAGKYLDTSLIDVDIQPNVARVLIKGKLLQLCLPSEVLPDRSTAQRSLTSGHLVLRMPKAGAALEGRHAIPPPLQPRNLSKRGGAKQGVDKAEAVSIRGIVGRKDEDDGVELIREAKVQRPKQLTQQLQEVCVDDDEVPPLE